MQLAKCILTSSNSAENYDVDAQNDIPVMKIGKAPTKKNVAQLLGITAVTPPLIAYISCIVSYPLGLCSILAEYRCFSTIFRSPTPRLGTLATMGLITFPCMTPL